MTPSRSAHTTHLSAHSLSLSLVDGVHDETMAMMTVVMMVVVMMVIRWWW